MPTTRGLGEELARLSLDLAAKEKATYSDFRLVNTRNQLVNLMNDNPSGEESNTLGMGVRVLHSGTGWGFAETDDIDDSDVRETTLKALALARAPQRSGQKSRLPKSQSMLRHGSRV